MRDRKRDRETKESTRMIVGTTTEKEESTFPRIDTTTMDATTRARARYVSKLSPSHRSRSSL